MVSRIGLRLCLIILVACTGARAADEAQPAAAPNGPPLAQMGHAAAWHDPSHHIRPHKGLRTDTSGRQVATLMWVLTSSQGQPLAIGGMGSSHVDIYFSLRLEAKLEQVARQYRLTTSQTDKLRLAAQVDLARLQRLAQRFDGALAEPAASDDEGMHERAVNKLFHALAVACDPQLFDADSLFQRVLMTQLQLQ